MPSQHKNKNDSSSEILVRAGSACFIIALMLGALINSTVFTTFLAFLGGALTYELVSAGRWKRCVLAAILAGSIQFAQLILPITKDLTNTLIVFVLYVTTFYLIVRYCSGAPKEYFKIGRHPEYKRLKKENPLVQHHLTVVRGVLYIQISLFILAGIYQIQWSYVLGLYLIVWLTDTGAFFIGRMIGGRKLAPKLSPGKTWSGFWGGVFVTAIVCPIVALNSSVPLFPISASFHMSWALIGGFTALLAVCAHLGDLYESSMKRCLGVKDMGHIIPGHGGFFDRFDSLLMVSLAYFWVVLPHMNLDWKLLFRSLVRSITHTQIK